MTAAAIARADAATPRVWVKTGTIAASASASAPAPMIVPGPAAVLVYAVVEPHYHLPSRHDDLVALGTEVGLALVVIFVAGKLVACRLVRLTASG
jgi:hypothetical protein